MTLVWYVLDGGHSSDLSQKSWGAEDEEVQGTR